MKKIFAAFAALALTGQMAIGQGVSDLEVIPVSVTINTVLRLNVVKGGNIEFVINTIQDFKDGVNTGGTKPQYDTKFTVAASHDYNVYLFSDDATLIGTDDPANTIPLNNIGWESTVLGANGTGSGAVMPLTQDLYAGGPDIHDAAGLCIDGSGAQGDITDNIYNIAWRVGTKEGTMNGGTLLSQNIKNDRYTTNAFLVLEEQ